tara:strand:- start:886 stop:1791 length:906 start_codon:yes stop_codon:yes gene_type:complete
MKSSQIDLTVDLGGLKLVNPVIAASGTFGYGLEFAEFVDLDQLGGFSTKGLSLKPQAGCPVPRVIETPSGMLNAIGLENIGLEKFLREKIPMLRNYKTALIVNFFGKTCNEYSEMANALSGEDRVDALEMNISCPNVQEGKLFFSSDSQTAANVVRSARKATDKFLIVKLSPNVTDITEIARAVEGEGADAISLINTLLGMSIDIDTGRPYLGNQTGGLSGPGIKPVALRMVYEAVRSVKIPIIGLGGIQNAEDAMEFLMAGANAIQIGTANFLDPSVTIKVLNGLVSLCSEKGINRLADL